MSLTTYHHRDAHILYDPARLAQPDLPILPTFGKAWLDPEAWTERGLVVGSAPGRGASQFLTVDEHQWVLRPYRRGGMAAKVSQADYLWTGLERTRGFREMRLTRALFERGLPVPAPIATIVVRHGLTYRAALITGRLPSGQTLAERLASAPPSLLVEAGATIRRFHDAGLDHVDLNARNLLVSADDKVWLIDFDRCRLRPPGVWQQRNLSRLKRSLVRFSPTTAQASYDLVAEGYHGALDTHPR